MFKERFTRIKELSERRRLPRLGKIRLGVKMISSGTKKEYPKETEYFIVPPEVTKIYGERPTSLDVMVPINDPEVVFPQAYKWYGGIRGLKCIGDGEVALRLREETQTMEEIVCPCEHLEKEECQKRAHFMVILPRINMGGVYQIDVGSYHSIVDINSGLDYVQALVGRFAMVPLRLCRTPKETHFGRQKQIHYTLQLFLDADVDTLNALRENTSRVLLSTRNLVLPPPEDVDENGVILGGNKEPEKEEVKPGSPALHGEGIQSATKESTSASISEKCSPDLPVLKNQAVNPAGAIGVVNTGGGNGSQVNPVRNSSGALNPAGIILKSNPAVEQRGIISNRVKSPEMEGKGREPRITEQQFNAIKRIAVRKGITVNPDALSVISYSYASRLIKTMQGEDFDPEELYGEFGEAVGKLLF